MNVGLPRCLLSSVGDHTSGSRHLEARPYVSRRLCGATLPRFRGAAALGLLTLTLACGSPNRGHWSGTFDGSVSGTVEFDINARGTRVEGRMTGSTVDGEPFRATLEGILRQDYFRADFEGRAGGSFGLPVPFEGEMTGSLDRGLGSGDWACTLWRSSSRLQGTWSVEQIEP